MNKSEQINELAAALSAFQGEVTNPSFSREVTVAGQKGSYKFKYAELNEILNLVRPILAKHGLSIVQSSTGDGDSVTVTTTLLHKSGQFLESSIPCARPDKMQELEDLLAQAGEGLDGAAAKASVSGSFNAAAVRGLGTGNHAERTAKASEETARNTKRLLDEAHHGGLQFT